MKTLLAALTALGICTAGACQIHYEICEDKQEMICAEKGEHHLCHDHPDTVVHSKHCNH